MLRIGILFGGDSREREISFAGGRTVYDNLDKTLFEPVPIFLDSAGNWILLQWQYLYKGTIRDFYPPAAFQQSATPLYIESYASDWSDEQLQACIEQVGKRIEPGDLHRHIDFAFLALHGHFGEDGQVQGLLDALSIPYSGSGLRASAIGIDKRFQKRLMQAGGFASPPVRSLSRAEWNSRMHHADDWILEQVAGLGYPLVVRPARQGSSIGVSIVQKPDAGALIRAFSRAFFVERLSAHRWLEWTERERQSYLRDLSDVRSALGFPLVWHGAGTEQTFYRPEALGAWLNQWAMEHPQGRCRMEGLDGEQVVLAEAFVEGKEFSCIVVRHPDGSPVALPPTEIVKGKEVFDYRSKYLPGLSRKVTPIQTSEAQIEAIRAECERLFDYLGFEVYARIDGFLTPDGQIVLNDPNTTSGMLPSSFFFHQAAEIGLNPSQFLTYIIRTSLWERARTSTRLRRYDALLSRLDQALDEVGERAGSKKRVAVLLGGYSSERHISVESGRNVYEKLSGSTRYVPIPIFLTGDAQKQELYRLPVNLLLKDHADDIRDKIRLFQLNMHPVVRRIRERCRSLTERYAPGEVLFAPQRLDYEDLPRVADMVFVALHGRPGEDGEVQSRLETLGLPYNGSAPDSSALTIDKYQTLQRLRGAGFTVADQKLLHKTDFDADAEACLDDVEKQFGGYPLVAKPVDDGCSSAVKVIRDRNALKTYLLCLFRDGEAIDEAWQRTLQLKPREEFPRKEVALLETLIERQDAAHFLEITGGLLTHQAPDGSLVYEMFEPSETLASGSILSLEEKFLAGEGQNITPARFAPPGCAWSHRSVSEQVRADLERAARLLGVTGYARIDAFVRIYEDGRAETIVIEVNSLPGMTPATCIFHQCALNGYSPYAFIDQILTNGRLTLADKDA